MTVLTIRMFPTLSNVLIHMEPPLVKLLYYLNLFLFLFMSHDIYKTLYMELHQLTFYLYIYIYLRNVINYI